MREAIVMADRRYYTEGSSARKLNQRNRTGNRASRQEYVGGSAAPARAPQPARRSRPVPQPEKRSRDHISQTENGENLQPEEPRVRRLQMLRSDTQREWSWQS